MASIHQALNFAHHAISVELLLVTSTEFALTRYFVKASDTTSVLTDTRNRSSWRGSRTVTVGVTLPLFR